MMMFHDENLTETENFHEERSKTISWVRRLPRLIKGASSQEDAAVVNYKF